LQARRTRRARAIAAGAAGLALVLAPAPPAGAGAGAGDEAGQPSVELERLLRVPDGVRAEPGPDRRGRATATEWRARFREARAELEEAQDALARARTELEGVAADTSQWQLAAPGALGAASTEPRTSSPQPGGGGSQTPLSYRLHQEIRRARDDVERAERRLRELDIEANLAGVPDAWREEPEEDEAVSAPPR